MKNLSAIPGAPFLARSVREKWGFGALIAVVLTAVTFAQSAGWLTIQPDRLCVTEGAIENKNGRMSVNVPKMRAYVNQWTSQTEELRFKYLGGTGKEEALGSGAIRRQFGLKLHAQDPCNLVYAMWRVEPKSELVVSVKSNPDAHTSVECGNRGYENIKPSKASDLPRLQAGQSHTLRAGMKNEELKVFVDDQEVWRGEIPADAAKLDGPVGIRSDNAHLEFDLLAGEYQGIHPNFLKACSTGAGD